MAWYGPPRKQGKKGIIPKIKFRKETKTGTRVKRTSHVIWFCGGYIWSVLSPLILVSYAFGCIMISCQFYWYSWFTIDCFLLFRQYFGPQFVHDASNRLGPPPYIDPYVLLEEERISQTAPPLNWVAACFIKLDPFKC